MKQWFPWSAAFFATSLGFASVGQKSKQGGGVLFRCVLCAVLLTDSDIKNNTDRLCGCRTLIATEETLLHPSRNPHLTREQIEDELKEFLGLEKVIWLWKGMAGDDAVGTECF